MDRYEVALRLIETIIRCHQLSADVEDAWTDGASYTLETTTGERFRLDVTMEGRVGQP